VANSKTAISCLFVAALASSAEPVIWDWRTVPITIEVLKDVPVETTVYGREKRGTLYSTESFLIKASERFVVTKLLREGACDIEFRSKTYGFI
jgi:hypothetical protein